MAASTHPLLTILGAYKHYGQRIALCGVDLTLQAGEILVLLGPNGAGKTTLIRAISGRTPLDAGTIRLHDQDPRYHRECRRQLGVVPQEIALYPYLTARENLSVFARLLGMPLAGLGLRINELLHTINLGDRADERTSQLSGGMQRRLNIAAGIIHQPQVLLLDEPMVGVDPKAREDIGKLLLQLKQQGLAILITTHDLHQAEQLADRIGVLIDGKIRALGTLKQLVDTLFGEGKELIVRFGKALATTEQEFLLKEGLSPAKTEYTWMGRMAGGFAHIAELGTRMAEIGLVADEIRILEPSLHSVFFHLTGEVNGE